jgi:hypothetical protein
MRRAEALHPPALLVDEDRGIATDKAAELADEPTQRVGTSDIPDKNDETPGLRIAEELPLLMRQRRPCNAGDQGAHGRRLARAEREGQACGG